MGDLSSQLGKVHVTPPQQLRPKPKPAQPGKYLQIEQKHFENISNLENVHRQHFRRVPTPHPGKISFLEIQINEVLCNSILINSIFRQKSPAACRVTTASR